MLLNIIHDYQYNYIIFFIKKFSRFPIFYFAFTEPSLIFLKKKKRKKRGVFFSAVFDAYLRLGKVKVGKGWKSPRVGVQLS